MLQKFISIAAFTSASDASIVRGLLETGGIKCRLQEERLSPNAPRYKGINGKTLVQVQRKDVAKSLRILKEKGYLRNEDFCISKWDLLIAKIWSW